VALASMVDILKELIAQKIPARLDDARQPRIINVGFVAAAAFAAEAQWMWLPSIRACRSRRVVRPKLPFVLAYSLFPMRKRSAREAG
jgi:hypothetical protein